MQDRINFLEKEFNTYYSYLRDSSSYLFEITYSSIDIDYERRQFSEHWTHIYFQRMYNILCVYFETLNLKDYLKVFKDTYGEWIKDEEKCSMFGSVLLEYGDSEDDLALLIEWRKFLAPFNFFSNNSDKIRDRKLIGFLKCTNEILKVTKAKVFREDDINNIIREVARFFFDEVYSFSEGYFVHRFKSYKPDVIIKEFNTAIEYKLIRNNSEIGTKLDELIIDARRYTNNPNNKYCIAVFCLSSNVTKTKKEIKEDWNNQHFPDNWKLIIIPDVKIENIVKKKLSGN